MKVISLHLLYMKYDIVQYKLWNKSGSLNL